MSSVARSTAAPAAVKRLFFFRHGQSVANLTGDTEVLDPSLTELGFQQAASWRSKVSSLDLDHVFVSPLRRTLQTATQIFQVKCRAIHAESAKLGCAGERAAHLRRSHASVYALLVRSL